jgi:hypothetical protein
MLDGVAGSSAARGDPDLAIDRGQVPVDGARTDGELLCDLGVGEPLGHQAQHLHLPFGQVSRVPGDFARGARCASTGEQETGGCRESRVESR